MISWRPKVKFRPPNDVGDFELDLFGSIWDRSSEYTQELPTNTLPLYVNDIKQKLESVLEKTGLSLWLMVDRLDEIFPRRSDLERTALRGILRASSGVRQTDGRLLSEVRARVTFSRMSEAFAVQMKGLGFWLWTSM